MGRPLEKRLFGNTSVTGNQIQVSAFVPAADGGSSAVTGYIVKQVGSKRFKVTTAQGTGICKLVVTAPAAGECRITLTDSAAGTYYASKISGRKVTVTANTGIQFATGSTAGWTIAPDVAVANSILLITSA
jgi:hypothetical protein